MGLSCLERVNKKKCKDQTSLLRTIENEVTITTKPWLQKDWSKNTEVRRLTVNSKMTCATVSGFKIETKSNTMPMKVSTSSCAVL